MDVGVVDEQVRTLTGWCASPDAAAAARSLLRSRRLPTDLDHVDDVLAELQFRVFRRLRRSGPLDDRPGVTSPVIAYARASLGTVVDDLLRGRRLDDPIDHRSGGDGPAGTTTEQGTTEQSTTEPSTTEPSTAGISEVELLSEVVDEVRRQLHLGVRPSSPWPSAAALTVLTLVVDPDHPLRPDTPQPDAPGAPEHQRARWSALAYAGRHDCFSDQDGAPDSACRNRRARALQSLDRVLADAYHAAVATEALE